MYEFLGFYIVFGIFLVDEILNDVIINESYFYLVIDEELNVVWWIFVFGLILLFFVFGVIGNLFSFVVFYY